jgi:hypothetical protein
LETLTSSRLTETFTLGLAQHGLASDRLLDRRVLRVFKVRRVILALKALKVFRV